MKGYTNRPIGKETSDGAIFRVCGQTCGLSSFSV